MTDLPEHMKMDIYKIYFTQKVCEQIKALRQQRVNDIISNMKIPDSISPLSPANLALIGELTDIGDFVQLIPLQTYRIKYDHRFVSIAYALDRFYSNTLQVQQQHILNANNYECINNTLNTTNFKHNEYFEKLYSKYLDYYDNRNTISFGYCCSNFTGFIMGSKTYKLELWAKFIDNYILT